jgi:hypothetical protein
LQRVHPPVRLAHRPRGEREFAARAVPARPREVFAGESSASRARDHRPGGALSLHVRGSAPLGFRRCPRRGASRPSLRASFPRRGATRPWPRATCPSLRTCRPSLRADLPRFGATFPACRACFPERGEACPRPRAIRPPSRATGPRLGTASLPSDARRFPIATLQPPDFR